MRAAIQSVKKKKKKKKIALRHTVLHRPCTAETPSVLAVPLKSRRSRVCVLFSTWQCWYFTREAARLGQGCQSAQPPSTFHLVLMHPFKGLAQGPAPTLASTIPLWLEKPQFRWTVRYKPSGSPRQLQKEINQFVSQKERRAANKVWPNLRGPCPNRQWPNVIRRIWQ